MSLESGGLASKAEALEALDLAGPRRLNGFDYGVRRSMLECGLEFLERCFVAFHHNLDGLAVAAVAHPAGQPEPLGVTEDEVAEADHLDATTDDGVEVLAGQRAT